LACLKSGRKRHWNAIRTGLFIAAHTQKHWRRWVDNHPSLCSIGDKGKRAGEHKTADYRAFYIGSGGNFLKNVHLDCASYDTAIKEAQQLADHNGIELWSGPRVVATLDHKSE
jgi:hypothetical protein